jgi:SET domain-containing protein
MAKSPVKTRVATSARRIQVRRSGIHGRGVYATAPIAAGERIVEYTGELIDWDEAMDRHPQNPDDPFHTFYFGIDDHWVIDANFGGNSARWINHACDPNCETEIVGKKVYIFALRDIEAGEELFYDYGLTIDERHTPKLKAEYACRCGAEQCRGTMLAPKRRSRASRG